MSCQSNAANVVVEGGDAGKVSADGPEVPLADSVAIMLQVGVGKVGVPLSMLQSHPD